MKEKLNIEITPELMALLDELAERPRPEPSPLAKLVIARLREEIALAKAAEAEQGSVEH